MKTILALTALTATLANAQVMNVNDGIIRDTIPSIYNRWSGYEMRTWAHYADGWRDVEEVPSCPENERVVNQAWTLVDDVAVYTWDCEAVPEPLPALYPDGIEAPFVVLQSETEGKGYAIIALDDGSTVTVLFHESPYPPKAELRERIEARIAEHEAKREAQRAAVGEFGKGQLQQRIEAIEAWIIAQEAD